jgi:hypothetical protein
VGFLWCSCYYFARNFSIHSFISERVEWLTVITWRYILSVWRSLTLRKNVLSLKEIMEEETSCSSKI